MRISNKIVLATTNKGKISEFKELFRKYPDIEVIAAKSVIRNADKIGLVEKYESYLENATAKARLTNQGAHYPALADDSGLEVEGLYGAPGSRSARYAIAKAGVMQDEANRQKLLEELKGKSGDARKARFVATLVLVIEGLHISATGVLEGRISEEPRGASGFGYDPLFIPEGSEKTLAEMTHKEKNEISHRNRALTALMEEIEQKGIYFARP
jgi:XTP/dITP diphosphohydrolase